MYPSEQGFGHLVAIFVAVGAVLLGLGWWLYRRYRDDRPEDQQSFREFRHALPEHVNEIVRKHRFPKTGTDIAVPDAHFEEMMRFYEATLEASGIRHLVFGHIGESHMHANLLPSTEAEFHRSKQLYLELAEKAIALGGTVSAEHGIGKLKHAFLEKMVGEKGIKEMTAVKKALDPACILGLGNIFPSAVLLQKK